MESCRTENERKKKSIFRERTADSLSRNRNRRRRMIALKFCASVRGGFWRQRSAPDGRIRGTLAAQQIRSTHGRTARRRELAAQLVTAQLPAKLTAVGSSHDDDPKRHHAVIQKNVRKTVWQPYQDAVQKCERCFHTDGTEPKSNENRNLSQRVGRERPAIPQELRALDIQNPPKKVHLQLVLV